MVGKDSEKKKKAKPKSFYGGHFLGRAHTTITNNTTSNMLRLPHPPSPFPRAPTRLTGLIKLLTLVTLDAVQKVAPVEVAVLARVGERVFKAGFGRDVPT